MDDAGAQHNGGKCTLWMGLLGHPPFVGCLFLTQTCGGRNYIPLKSAVSTVPSLFSAPGSFFILRPSGFIAASTLNPPRRIHQELPSDINFPRRVGDGAAIAHAGVFTDGWAVIDSTSA